MELLRLKLHFTIHRVYFDKKGSILIVRQNETEHTKHKKEEGYKPKGCV